MNTTTNMITLANGKQVLWDDFSAWSPRRQRNALKPRPDYKNQSCIEFSISRANSQRKSIEAGTKSITRNCGCKNGQSRAVLTPDGEFPTIRATARHYGVGIGVIDKWIKHSKKDQFKFKIPLTEAKVRGIAGIPKAVLTPKGLFRSIQSAADHYGVGRRVIHNWINTKRFGNFSYAERSEQTTTSSAKPVTTPAGFFISQKMAANHYGVNPRTIGQWVKEGKLGFESFTDSK